MKLASSRFREDELFYVTPTQPPITECPKDHSCHTLQYHLENNATIDYCMNSSESNRGVTLMFLSGNHTVIPCYCTKCTLCYFSANFSMIELGDNIVIHNLDALFLVAKLTIENVIFYKGRLLMIHAIGYKFIQLHIDSVQLIECVLFIQKAESGEIVKLQAHNSQVSIRSSNNVKFTNCIFRDNNHNLALIFYLSFITLACPFSITPALEEEL